MDHPAPAIRLNRVSKWFFKDGNRIAAEKKAHYLQSLAAGEIDDRKPLEPARRAFFKRIVKEFNPKNHPETIPETFTEAECNVFGH